MAGNCCSGVAVRRRQIGSSEDVCSDTDEHSSIRGFHTHTLSASGNTLPRPINSIFGLGLRKFNSDTFAVPPWKIPEFRGPTPAHPTVHRPPHPILPHPQFNLPKTTRQHCDLPPGPAARDSQRPTTAPRHDIKTPTLRRTIDHHATTSHCAACLVPTSRSGTTHPRAHANIDRGKPLFQLNVSGHNYLYGTTPAAVVYSLTGSCGTK